MKVFFNFAAEHMKQSLGIPEPELNRKWYNDFIAVPALIPELRSRSEKDKEALCILYYNRNQPSEYEYITALQKHKRFQAALYKATLQLNPSSIMKKKNNR